MTSPASGAAAMNWKSDEVTRTDRQPWDLLVIGGGTAGLVAAQTASGLGASVLMIERARTGGDCLWTGCVPSKALLAAAHSAADARDAVRYGIHVADVRVDFPAVMEHVHQAIAAIQPDDDPEAVRAAGIRVAHGEAVFSGEDRVVFTADPEGLTQTVRFRHCVIATGSTPRVPDIPGLPEAAPVTSESIWEITELPERLLVIGGGSIGCELGQAFSRLGAQVTILECADRLLGPEDERSAQVVHDALVRDGVRVLTGVSLDLVESSGAAHRAHLNDRGTVDFDTVLVAVGRTARTADLAVSTAGIAVDDRGQVVVDAHLRTSNPRIYAAGDVTQHPKFTHVAGVHGSLAGSNAVLGLPRSIDSAAPPRVTFTQPELAAFGVAPADAEANDAFMVHVVTHDDVDRAVAERRTEGLTQVVLDKRGKVVGASIVGPRAGESLAELVLAARGGLRARDVAGVMHSYPTYNDGIWDATIAQVRQQLNSRPVQVATRAVAAIRRRRS